MPAKPFGDIKKYQERKAYEKRIRVLLYNLGTLPLHPVSRKHMHRFLDYLGHVSFVDPGCLPFTCDGACRTNDKEKLLLWYSSELIREWWLWLDGGSDMFIIYLRKLEYIAEHGLGMTEIIGSIVDGYKLKVVK